MPEMNVATESSIEQILAEFDDQGYVILRGIIDPDAVQQARDAMNSLVDRAAAQLMAEGKTDNDFRGEPFEKRLHHLYRKHMDEAPVIYRHDLHLPGMFGLFFNSQVLDIIEGMMGGEIRLYPNYSVRPKLPDHAGSQVLWHQDGGYTAQRHQTVEGPVQTLRMVNLWSPLVSTTVENGCMQFVPGTHRLGVVPHADRGYYLEIAPEELQPRLAQAVPIELEPGDVVLFHNLLFHAGLPNKSDTIRWSADWRYQDATQPTLRPENGHIARSRSNPESEVKSSEEWGDLEFA